MLGSLLAGATSFGGCGSVAGPEYTGEVGLELRGEVVSLDEGQEDLVPALAFLGEEGLYLVDGEITGEFPKNFTMRVDQAPPDGALLSRTLDGAPLQPGAPDRVAVAFLVLVARDHAPTLPHDALSYGDTSSYESSVPDPETGEFTRTATECSTDGERCETKVYSCSPGECETVLVQERSLSEEAVAWNTASCIADSCLTQTLSCDGEVCARTFRHCERDDPADQIFSDGTIDRCTLQGRSGQAPGDGRLGSNFAQDLIVIFASERADVEGIHVEQGYNVLRGVAPEDKKAWAEVMACRADARYEVLSSPGEESEEEIEARIEAAAERCGRIQQYERLENPASHELQISLGEPDPIF